jgi:hypothetical protein
MIAEDLRALRVERDNRCGRLRCAALSGCIHDLLLGLLGFLRRCARFSMLRSAAGDAGTGAVVRVFRDSRLRQRSADPGPPL